MNPFAVRRIAAVAGFVVVVVAAILVLHGGGGARDAARAAARTYLAAWTRGDDRGAAAATDAPGPAFARLSASRSGLDGARVAATLSSVTADGDRGHARVDVRWTVPAYGAYGYTVTLPLTKAGDKWHVVWQPTDVSPDLGRHTRLGTVVDAPVRAPILDRDGRELVGNRPVVNVAVQTDKVTDPQATASALASALDVKAGPLAKAIAAAPKGRFIPVITLRRADYQAKADMLADIPGISTAPSVLPLAPSRDFGRALLGTVGPATAEQVQQSKGRVAAGTNVGQSGLEATFDARLAGRAGERIVTRDMTSGEVRRTLARHPSVAPKPVKTTLDTPTQRAAESALDGVDGNAALVALQPSTGDVLAVANRPADSTYDRALVGRYPPGSTFKIVTTAALLAAGFSPSNTVDCPPTLTVDGKSFRNFEGEAAGAVPFEEDFAQSCNTAFVSLAPKLDAGALTSTAREFGLGRSAKLGVPTADSAVPEPAGAVNQAAMMIGQDKIVATPLAMAGVAGTVAAGNWNAPRILAGDPTTSGPSLPGSTLSTLRGLMRTVVTSGTGTALANIPGEPAGKTGTAEFGGGDPPPTHAWFVAIRGDLAIAVLVENGASGASVAAPLAAKFFTALGP